jgi:drug/metabolite transporter (DMT)-like permease
MVPTSGSTARSASARSATATRSEPTLGIHPEPRPIVPRPSWVGGDLHAGPARHASRPAPGSGMPALAPSTQRRLAAGALALAGTLYGASTDPLDRALSTGASPSAFVAVRFAFAAFALLIFCRRPIDRPATLAMAGLGCGLTLAASYLCLARGLPGTGSTTAGVLVSAFSIWAAGLDAIRRRRRPSRMATTALVVASGGLLLLCEDGTGLAAILAASGFLAVHLLLLGAAAGRVKALHLTAVQSVVVAVVCAGPATVDGAPHMTMAHWLLAAALGICVSGGAYLLQALGQAVVPVTTAGLLLMTEPVIAVLVGWLAGERPTAHRATGIGLLTLAILLAIWAPKRANTHPFAEQSVEVTRDGAGLSW